MFVQRVCVEMTVNLNLNMLPLLLFISGYVLHRARAAVAGTHQEAHEVEGEHGGHPSEWQPLQHRAADASGVAVIFGLAVSRAVFLTAARLAAAEYRHGNNQRAEHYHCHILAENLREEENFM